MVQNRPMWVTYSGLRANGRSPTSADVSSDGPWAPACREASVSGRERFGERPKNGLFLV